MQSRTIAILLAVGGSGGHLFPARQLASLLAPKAFVHFAGHGLKESPLFTKNVPFSEIRSANPKRGILFFLDLCIGVFQSFSVLRKLKIDVVVGFGSYHALPLLIASVFLRKKIVLFEANVALGKVNRLFVPFASHLALHFPLKSFEKKGVFVDPLPWGKAKEKIDRLQALSHYGLEADKPVLLIMGGSQGSFFFNQKIPPLLEEIGGFQVLHLFGKQGEVSGYHRMKRTLLPFEEEMERAYAVADFVLCRAGASSLAELIVHRLPALLVPFPHSAGDHQEKNARWYEKEVGGGICLKQEEITHSSLSQALQRLMEKKETFQVALSRWEQKRPPTIPMEKVVLG